MATTNTLLPIAEAVADLLSVSGVRRIYTVPGESFLPLLDAFDSHKDLRVISTRHEGGAAFMAEADAKLTGSPTVVMATRGVGARSEEYTSELQSRFDLVCRLLLEKKKQDIIPHHN